MSLDDVPRLDELRRYELFDGGHDAGLDGLAELAARVCTAPIGLISFIDEQHQRFLAHFGLPPDVGDRIPRAQSFCASAFIDRSSSLECVPDVQRDPRFAHIPYVTSLSIHFYTGVPLVTPSGYVLGTVCVFDRKKRELEPDHARAIATVRDLVMELLEARRELGELRSSESLRQEAVEALVATQHDLTRRIELRTREIEEAHQKTRQLLERIGDGYIALDRNWRYLYVNERAAQLFGRSAAELIGKHIWTEFPEGVGQPFQLAYERAMRDLEMVTIEARYEPWGRWFENRIYPSPNGVAVFFTEITDRKRAEEELERSRRRLLEAQRVAHVGSWEWDRATDRVLWSDELYRVYGLPVGAPLGGYQQFLERVHPDNLADTERIVAAAIEAGAPFIYDHHIVRPDGTVRMLHTRGEAIREEGKVVRLVGCCWDVTELHQMTGALQRTGALLEATLAVASDCLLVVDADGSVNAYNAPLAALFQLPVGQAAPVPIATIAAQLRDPALLSARTQEPGEIDETLALRDGRLLEARSRPHLVAGRVAGRVWSFRLAAPA